MLNIIGATLHFSKNLSLTLFFVRRIEYLIFIRLNIFFAIEKKTNWMENEEEKDIEDDE